MTTTTQRKPIVDQIFAALVEAPSKFDPTVPEVLGATGRFASAVLVASYKDQDERRQVVRWFIGNLLVSTDPARLAQRQSLN